MSTATPEKKATDAHQQSDGVVTRIDLSKLESGINAGITNHTWRQKGPYLVCTSCKVKHGVFVGLTKCIKQVKANGELVLEDIPILSKRR